MIIHPNALACYKNNNFACKNKDKKGKISLKKSAFSYENSVEYRVLIQTFSSGARLKELASIAIIISKIIPDIKEPSRDEKRNFPLLIGWYHDNWELVYPILPFINLRDENNEIIDGKRELMDMKSNSKKYMNNVD